MPIELMQHQQEWVDRVLHGDLKDRRGVALFGEAGTGKTYPMCLVAHELIARHGGHALFIVPTRLTWNWLLELQKMCPDIASLQTLVIYGTRKQRVDQLNYLRTFSAITNMYVIIGYDALRIEQQEFQDMDFTLVATDEAHKFKNRLTQTARAVKSIEAQFRFTLTGTPITNRPNDLWSIMHFLDPGPTTMRTVPPRPPRPGSRCPEPSYNQQTYSRAGCTYCRSWANDACIHGANTKAVPPYVVRYRGRSPTWDTYNDFESRYCDIEFFGRFRKIVGGRNMAELHRRMDNFGMTRWRVDDVLKLKPLMFSHVRLEPTPQEQRNYQRVRSGIINMLTGDGDNGLAMSYFTRSNPLALITYLRQCTVLTPTAFAALRGGLLDELLEFTNGLETSDLSSKEEWLLDLLEDINGEKVLVYGHWIGACDHLMATLRKKGIGAVGIYGNHNKSPQDAARIMEQFATDPDLRVIVGNESMAEGLNFQSARYVVFLHLPWIPKDVIQFIGRAHRIGQQGTVVVYFLSHHRTIDERMAETCMSKQEDSDDIFDPNFTRRSAIFNIDTRQGLLGLLEED